ncbi:ribbon-helix-helix / copG family protein [Synechococcus sp. BIOS-U3-1]|uniref:ribbon-helix-helix domain-containing protein n=1 Tax=Synechococcus sp. BIOS-U3-1 TaxID=1400865 RepID=UPI001645C94B|nr:hypothetical protein [Synechococcus sp. BIOS-U3-1]QNI58943.1 ribbon-helix-helix / copG family protein [Synechococcus sp. BIOS-U3-1]
MAVRQKSASTSNIKKPRIQVVLREEICQLLEEHADERGQSVSSFAARIIEDYFDEGMSRQTSGGSSAQDVANLLRMVASLVD